MLCIYHSIDLDGQCSGAIVKYKYPQCKLYGMNYGQDIPWDLIDQHNTIFLVDFSFQPEEMIKFVWLKDKQTIWIDHHKSIIDSMIDYKVDGIQRVGVGACELAWEYLFSKTDIPLAVQLLSQYDVWNHKDPRVLPFQYGLRLEDTHPSNQNLWPPLFSTLNSVFVNSYVDKGKAILRHINKENMIFSKQCFELKFEGYNCIAINKSGSSKLFDYVKNLESYDLMLTFMWKHSKWIIIMYSSKDEIDVSEIAIKYKGGGHVHAAGFQIDKLPFELN